MYTHISLKLFDLHFFVRLILKDKSKASTLLLSRYITAFSYTKKEVPQKISAIPLSIKINIKIILTQ